MTWHIKGNGIFIDDQGRDMVEHYVMLMSPIAYKTISVDYKWAEVMPEHIIFNGVTTVCIFGDGTKVISRPQKGENFDKETGVAMCIAKYIYGSRSKFLKAVEKGKQQ